MQNILLDCDGVLYPLSELSTADIVNAAKQTYRDDLGLSGIEQSMISKQTIDDGHLGLFNYIKAICEYKNCNFDTFCTNMAERIDYSHIIPNKALWYKLHTLSAQYNIAIASNNSRVHISKVIEHLFGKNADDIEQSGIRIFDITAMRNKEGWFTPKRVPNCLKLLALRNKFEPSETILFDDTGENIKAARKIGMHATLITSQNTLENNLQPFIRKPLGKSRIYEGFEKSL